MLREYLKAWFPILSSRQERIVFIDGFAGPGEYQGGEEGSPLIALRALVEHSARIKAEIIFFFIEKDPRRVDHLERIVSRWDSSLPNNAKVSVFTGQFDETMTDALDRLDEQKKKLAPAFVMIDPFGVAGTPMSVIRRIMGNPQCEIYFSLMYESINRFSNTPEFEKHLDSLFGCPDWRQLISISDPEQRRNALYDLYERQLREAGAKYVVKFGIYESNRLIYTIFFATQHEIGCDRMKEAVWKIDPHGSYRFRGTHSGQLELSMEPSFEPLKKQLISKFSDGRWHSIEEIQSFMRSDETDYFCGQLKTRTLKPMEIDGLIEVDASTRKRAKSFPPNCLLRFMTEMKSG